jgi:rhamnogalacturonyl hydrolase YesR
MQSDIAVNFRAVEHGLWQTSDRAWRKQSIGESSHSAVTADAILCGAMALQWPSVQHESKARFYSLPS